MSNHLPNIEIIIGSGKKMCKATVDIWKNMTFLEEKRNGNCKWFGGLFAGQSTAHSGSG